MRHLCLASALLLAPLLGLCAQDPSCPRGPADDRSIQVQVTLAESRVVIVEAVARALDTLGYEIDSTQSQPGYWVTKPDFRWPRGTEDETWHTDAHPGLQLIAVIEPAAADSTSLTVAARVVCLLETPERDAASGSVPSMLEMIGAMLLANEVREWLDLAK